MSIIFEEPTHPNTNLEQVRQQERQRVREREFRRASEILQQSREQFERIQSAIDRSGQRYIQQHEH